MRIALIIASAVALAVGIVIAVGGDEEDDNPVVETTPVTTPETAPEQVETTPEHATQPPNPVDPDATADDNGGAEAPQTCGRIAFNPSTDSGASQIEAAGTDCATARAVARGAKNAADELSYEAESFRCAGTRSNEQGLSAIEWVCIGADREVVSFLTT